MTELLLGKTKVDISEDNLAELEKWLRLDLATIDYIRQYGIHPYDDDHERASQWKTLNREFWTIPEADEKYERLVILAKKVCATSELSYSTYETVEEAERNEAKRRRTLDEEMMLQRRGW